MKALILLLFVLLGCTSKNCISTDAAFDVGSASTKMVVAKVNRCEHKIIETLYQSQKKVNYKESLSSSDSFPAEVIKSGEMALSELKKEAKKFTPNNYYGVATEAFRNAKNGSQAIQKLSQSTSIAISLIDQQKEAKLGFLAAKSQANTPNVIAWDIGGGSMQISNGKETYRGQLASVTFKNHILSQIQKKNDKVTPNPMSKNDRFEAIRMAIRTADLNVPASIKKTIIRKKGEVIGIGSVHFYSIKKLTHKDVYTVNDLNRTLKEKAGLSDRQLGGDYASTDYSNLCLVYGFMKGLGIQKVKAANVNLAHGLLLENSINL